MNEHPSPSALDRLQTDRPIQRRSEDDLKRLPFIDLLAEEVRNASTSEGFVMALTGAWGDGKTSVLNLVADALDDEAVVVTFNPWLFTDAHALVIRFFSELGAQVGQHHRLRQVGKKLVSYGKAVAPLGSLLVGPAADLLGRALGALDGNQAETADQVRQELSEELRRRGQRVVVLIDDIDRLHDAEILDVMRLVKLVGDLPFVTYLLAFDRPYVEKAIDREQTDGHSYLEKVVQVSYDLPRVRQSELQGLLLGRLNKSLANLTYLEPRQERWEELLARGMMPFFRNVRDVVRFSSTVRSSVKLIGKDVALEDVLALETLRVFEPQLHQELPKLSQALTKQRAGIFIDNDAEEDKEKELIEASLEGLSLDRRARATTLLALIFPRAGDALGGPSYRSEHWKSRRQVADASVLRTYIHASVDPGMASYGLIEDTLDALGDHDALRTVLDDVEPEVLSDLLSQLPDFSDRITSDRVGVTVSQLLALETRLPEEDGPFRPVPSFYLKNAIRAILEVLSGASERQECLEQAFSNASTESERFNLMLWFGSFEERERKQQEFEILSVDQTRQLQQDLNNRVRSIGPNALVDEPRFKWLVFDAYRGDGIHQQEFLDSVEDKTLLHILHRFVTFSLDSNANVFDLGRAEELIPQAALLDRIEEIEDAKVTQSDREMLSLLRSASDQKKSES